MSGAPDSLRGSIVPLVTPFAEGAVDTAAFEAAVQRQVVEGSHGVVVTGTTGEPTSLTVGERADLYRRAVAVAGGRIAVVAATGTPNQDETVALTRAAQNAGVDAALVVCPAFVRPSQAGLVAHFTTVAAATDLPVLIYNIPGRSGVGVTAETVERVVAAAPSVVGVKHASNDLDLVTDLLLRLGEDFRLFCGLESYSYPFLAVGGAGLMSAVGNLFPTAVADLCEHVFADEHAAALALHRRLFRINEAVFFDTNPGPLKAMLAAAGAGSAEVRPPLVPLSDDTRERVLAALAASEAALAGA
ncbi:4-hydroxy-tetrahydrodipicolinate synthase [Baekduia alba]|uniref:4-hydroxy-tetrahydrodipicolinate synthase n=1 Tax=Baekduia alba TaxID=2997333 RepID=UPI0023426F45|nr:4-hydroxy-tetrahydrodipicolinate synthase [Baekduia alba]WCB95316.1 4-hydroxy-tetrahydrodipicolinate synthase [Baekduia alba]